MVYHQNDCYIVENINLQEPSFPQAVRMRRIAAGSGLIILMVSMDRKHSNIFQNS